MLFKKSKGPIITLGLGPPSPAERVPDKAPPPAVSPEPAAAPPPPVQEEAAPAPAEETAATPVTAAAVATTVPMREVAPPADSRQHAAPPPAEEIQPAPLLYPHTPPLPHKPPVPGPAAGKDDATVSFLAPEPSAEHTQCPYCLELTPAGKEHCDHCGNRLGETGALAPVAASAPAPAPAEAPLEPAGPAPAEDEVQPMPLEVETRKLTSKPTPTVLKETTIFTPAQLTLLDDPRKATGQVFTLNIGQTRIGRGQDNDLPFPEEEFISRHHCEIGYHKYQYVLKDLQSANGSYVNDVRVRETILRDGDLIQIGSLRFLFEDPLEKMKKRKAEAGADRD